MPFKVGDKYDGQVTGAKIISVGQNDRPAIKFRVRTAEGQLFHTMWISPKTIDRAVKTLNECFGFSRAQLAGEGFLEAIGEKVTGADVSIVADTEDDGKGGVRWVAKWMNPRGGTGKAATPAAISAAARLFGGQSAPASGSSGSAADDWGISDDQVPFR